VHFPDRFVQRNVVPRTQRAHVRGQAAGGYSLFQRREIVRRRVGADERLVFGTGQETDGLVTGRLDLLQRLVEAPRRPWPVETPDGPTYSGAVER
jgi:hypothetical protein